MNPLIALHHIKQVFGSCTAVSDVSCTVQQGEIFGLLGPSGAGKTTLIKILTGQLQPSKGYATIFETDTKKIPDAVYSKIGMVLDNSGLYTRLSCYDNLRIFADIYGLKNDRIEAAMEAVQLTDAMKRPVSKLSRGMAQRLVFARAIINSPALLFLDEPTSGLDPATAMTIHKLIFDLRKKGTTIFLTTHNMAEATKLCDNVALLNEGKIVEYGAPDAICRQHNHKQVVSVLLKSGENLELANDHTSSLKLAQMFKEELVLSIHSSEPDLESVFITLTGRKLV